MTRQSQAEARGRGVRRRHGPSDGSRESQSSAAALGGRGAAAGAASGRPIGEEHHGVGRGAGLRSCAAAQAESCRVERQGVTHKAWRSSACWGSARGRASRTCWATFLSFTRSHGKQPSDLMAENTSPAS